MNQDAGLKTKKDLRYYSWPVGIIIFFILCACFNTFLALTAFGGRPAATEESPYEAALLYDQKYDSREVAKSAGLSDSFIIRRTQESLLVNYQLPKSLDLDSISSISLKLIRPNDISLNSETAMEINPESSSLEASAPNPQSGLWMLELSLNIGGKPALIESQIYVK